MKKLITLAIAICFTIGSVYAGCGTKIEVKGKITGYDAEKKELTVTSGKKDAPKENKITLEATVAVTGKDGAEAKIEDLMEKRVVVSTDKHTKKGESIALMVRKKKPKA